MIPLVWKWRQIWETWDLVTNEIFKNIRRIDDYNKEIIIPKEVCDKLIIYIQGYKKPHKLMFDMQKNVPLLYTEIKNIFGDNKLDNSAEMHDMGFSD